MYNRIYQKPFFMEDMDFYFINCIYISIMRFFPHIWEFISHNTEKKSQNCEFISFSFNFISQNCEFISCSSEKKVKIARCKLSIARKKCQNCEIKRLTFLF